MVFVLNIFVLGEQGEEGLVTLDLTVLRLGLLEEGLAVAEALAGLLEASCLVDGLRVGEVLVEGRAEESLPVRAGDDPLVVVEREGLLPPSAVVVVRLVLALEVELFFFSSVDFLLAAAFFLSSPAEELILFDDSPPVVVDALDAEPDCLTPPCFFEVLLWLY